VDSATALFQTLLGGTFDTLSNAVANLLVLALRDAAVKHGAAVVVTNNMLRGFEDGSVKPALGQWWTHVPSVKLQLCGKLNIAQDNDKHAGGEISVFTIKLVHSTLIPIEDLDQIVSFSL